MIKVFCTVKVGNMYKRIGFKTDKTLTHAIEEICSQLGVSYHNIYDVETYNMHDFEVELEENITRRATSEEKKELQRPRFTKTKRLPTVRKGLIGSIRQIFERK